MIQKYQKILSHLGMNEYERDIYLLLLTEGSLNISDIALKIGRHRPLVYRTLAGLESDGYVSKTKKTGKRIYYQANSPEILRERAIALQAATESVIPELVMLHEKKEGTPNLTYKVGIDGIRSIHEDLVHSLPKGGVYCRYSSSRNRYHGRSIYVPDDYFDVQKKKELERYVITSEGQKPLREGNPYRSVVSIPKSYDLFEDNITKLIYDGKVAIIDYDTQTGWIIEDARFARYEEKIFHLLFKLLKK